MSDERCEPPEELRGVDGWHWVSVSLDKPGVVSPVCMRWATFGKHAYVWDHLPLTDYWSVTAEEVFDLGYRYLSPIPTPAELAAAKDAERAFRLAVSVSNEEICQMLGRALGYPRYADDSTNFPDAMDADGVCVGDHVAETIVAESAAWIAAAKEREAGLSAAVERLRAAFRINMIRLRPAMSHEIIDAELDRLIVGETP